MVWGWCGGGVGVVWGWCGGGVGVVWGWCGYGGEFYHVGGRIVIELLVWRFITRVG